VLCAERVLDLAQQAYCGSCCCSRTPLL